MRFFVGILLWALTTAPALAADRIALLIGNGAYLHTTRLKSPTLDVGAMGAALEALGFEVETLADADRRSMGRAIRGFNRKAREADTALLYYSGHGMEIAGRNYLVPVDAQLEEEADAGLEAIGLGDAIAAAAGAKRLSVVVLDACRDNRFASATKSGSKGFTPVVAQPGQLIAYATAAGTVAYDGGGALSPYTQALTEALGRRSHAALDVRVLFGGLGRRVSDLAGGPQNPAVYQSGFGPEIVTLTGLAAATAPKPTPGGAGREAAAQAAYEAVKDRGDAEALALVASRFPGTFWGDLAARDAERLRAAREAEKAAEESARQAALYRDIQTELKRLGDYRGEVDGVWGASSLEALKAFQRRERLDDYGPTMWTFAALRQAKPPGPRPGETFRDCDVCPEMIVIPEGSFTMGSPEDEPERLESEGPQRAVRIGAFAIGKYEVTFEEWDECLKGDGCGGYSPEDRGWGRGDRPVINVSWLDAQAYLSWLNSKVEGSPYRLPTEAEWEYAARAGAPTPFWWGRSITPDEANYDGSYTYSGGGSKGDYREKSLPVRSFEPNPFGLYQVHGNVWEWAQDCWHDSYDGAPIDGSAWMEDRKGDCSLAVLRSGAWDFYPRGLRSASRGRNERDGRNAFLGFRVARTLSK